MTTPRHFSVQDCVRTRPDVLEDARQHPQRFFSAVVEQDGGRMIGNDFVKEMQEALLTQQEQDDPASRASPGLKGSQTEAHKDWDALVAWIEGKISDTNSGLPEPLLQYSKPREEEFDLANEAGNMTVTAKREPNGNVAYRGTAASGQFCGQLT